MIIVGVDGSQAALKAVSWAVGEAGVRGAALRIVHAVPALPLTTAKDAAHADTDRRMRDAAASMLTAALERARQEDPRVKTESSLLAGDPRLVLIEAAKEAELLVVGSSGLGGFQGMLLGLVAFGVVGHTACPIAVIRNPPAQARGEVVVGVDGSPDGRGAIEFAFAEASLRGAGLRAIHAWNWPVGCGTFALSAMEEEETAEGERRLLAEALAGWSERYPDVKLIEQAEHGIRWRF